jgi:hypothetical protein
LTATFLFLFFLIVVDRVGCLADFIRRLANLFLYLAGILLQLAGHFLALVSGDFACGFLYRSLHFVLCTFGSILVHVIPPFACDDAGRLYL